MYQYHYSNLSQGLNKILKNDDYDKFLKLYKDRNDVQKDFYVHICSHTNRDKCKDQMIIPNIISRNMKINKGKITSYVMKNYKLYPGDVVYLARKFKSLKADKTKDSMKKLLTECLLHMHFNDKNNSYIMDNIFSSFDWDLIVLYHSFGYRVSDINKYVTKIPYNKIDELVNLEYKFNANSILKLLGKYDIESDLLKKLGFNKSLIKNLENKKDIVNLYKNGNIKLINFIEKNGFVSDDDCLNMAVNGHNFEVINHLINNKKFELYEHHFNTLFLIKEEKKKKKKKKKLRRRYSSTSWKVKRDRRLIGEKILNKIDKYEEHMLKILKTYNVCTTFFDNIFKKSIDHLLLGNCFELVAYMSTKLGYSVKTLLSKETTDILIRQLIEDDDVDTLKKLFASKLVLPIEISTDIHNMNDALRMNSSKMIEYFDKELKMVCSINMHGFLEWNSVNCTALLDNLLKIEYPISDTVITSLIKSGKFTLIEKLIDKGYGMPQMLLDMCIIHKKYSLFDKLIANGFSIQNKNRYIDKIVKLSGKEKSWGWRYYYRHGDSFKLNSVRQFQYMIKNGCNTRDKTIINILIKHGQFGLAIYLHKVFEYVPDPVIILSFITQKEWRYRKYINKQRIYEIINALEYFKENANINIFNDQFPITSFCRTMSYCIKESLPLFKYIIKESGIKLDTSHMCNIFNYSDVDVSDLKELLSIFKEHNIEPTREIFIELLRIGHRDAPKYLIENYDFTLTLKEIHNFINSMNFEIGTIFYIVDLMKIKITPYTIDLVYNAYATGFWCRSTYIHAFIMYIKRMMVSTYEQAINGHNKEILKLERFIQKNSIKLVEYVPDDDEIPDVAQPVFVHDLHDDNSSNDNDEEKDYVDQILDEYKV